MDALVHLLNFDENCAMDIDSIKEIQRYPLRKNDPLQGWDAADVLILEQLKDTDLANKKILIINDHFGALSCTLRDMDVTTYTDSFVSSRAILHNSKDKICPIENLSLLKGPYDLVIIQIPKNSSFFEDILCHLSGHLHSQSKIICGSMVKHLSPVSFNLLEKYIGKTTTSLAKKKARLIFAAFEKSQFSSPYPLKIKVEGFQYPFTNHSNLFSRDKLDIGTRFFLNHIPQGNYKNILDLGCANGIIGIKARMENPDARIHFSDESALAIESSKENYSKYFEDTADFYWTNCFENQASNIMDLVLCNPPFHQGNTVGDFIANQMFRDAFRVLKKGGALRVIGNSHLGYQVSLKKIFGNSKIVATNNKFVICEALK